MGISIEQWRVTVGLFHRCRIGGYQVLVFSINFDIAFIFEWLRKMFSSLNRMCKDFLKYIEACFRNLQFLLVMILLLLEAGDVERSPGPIPEHTLSVFHLSIRSIRNKIEYLRDNFTILIFFVLPKHILTWQYHMNLC